MSLLLNTGAMKYRENASDSWHPLIIKADVEGTVRYDEVMSLTSAQQAQARSNIGAGSVSTLNYTVVRTF